MKCTDGPVVRIGDRVRLRNGDTCEIVASMDTDEYSNEFPAARHVELRTGTDESWTSNTCEPSIMKRRILMGSTRVLIVAAVAVLAACENRPAEPPKRPEVPRSEGSADQTALVDRLQAALASCDPQVWTRLPSVVFTAKDASDGVGYLASQWNRADQPECLRRPLVRAFVANTLAQAHANGVGESIDVSTVRDALRECAESSDWQIAHICLSGLSVVAESADLQLFAQIARTRQGPTRDEALFQLASQCSDDATRILDDLSHQPGFSDIGSIQAKAGPIRANRCQH